MRNAASLLAAGSFFLLGGWTTLFVRGLQAVALSALLSWVGVILHLAGWLFLYQALFDPAGTGATVDMRIAFVASAIAPIVLIFAIPQLLVVISTLVFTGTLAMIPLVSGPVFVGHGLIFLLGTQERKARSGIALVVVGSFVLIGIGAGALLAELISTDLRILALAGLTGFGYLIVGWGWAWEHQKEASTRRVLGPEWNKMGPP